MTRIALPLPVLLLAPLGLAAADGDLRNAVVSLRVPDRTPAYNAVTLADGTTVPAQLTGDPGGRRVVFVLPTGKAGAPVAVAPREASPPPGKDAFKFADEKGRHTDLLLGTKPVLRYVNAAHDPKDHFYTFKPFHHVFDPADGKTLLTSGTYKTNKEGTFPHHRGLFYGWNKISYDGKAADVWHGTNNVFSQHEKVLAEEAGPVFGRQRAQITWHGPDGMTFATEERELTAYATPGGTLIDFASVLSTDRPSVKLDGDPQHAGFHFRANMEVAGKDVAKQTYYLRPDGKGKPGETRNWDAKNRDPKTVNLPWDACSFVVGGKRYTVLRINHPDNPKEARGSERDYGRFGDYFEYELTPKAPLKVRYRVWVQEGEMTADQCNAMAAAFVSPPAGTVEVGK